MNTVNSVLESSILTLVNRAIEKAGYDKTRTGVVQAINPNGTYQVLIDGISYPSVPILNTYTADVGDTVKVKYPSGNVSQMYICNGRDSGWRDAELESEFGYYSDDSHPKFRKCGNIVSIAGAVTPTTTISGSITLHKIFTLPEGYRPTHYAQSVSMQGSGVCQWEMRINPDGSVSMSRYRNGSGYTNCVNGNWLPLSHTFLI